MFFKFKMEYTFEEIAEIWAKEAKMEGKVKGKIETLIELGQSPKEISMRLSMPVSKIKEIIKTLHEQA